MTFSFFYFLILENAASVELMESMLLRLIDTMHEISSTEIFLSKGFWLLERLLLYFLFFLGWVGSKMKMNNHMAPPYLKNVGRDETNKKGHYISPILYCYVISHVNATLPAQRALCIHQIQMTSPSEERTSSVILFWRGVLNPNHCYQTCNIRYN